MPVFIAPSTADVLDPAFWAGLNVEDNSTFNATGVGDAYEITMTGSGISITDTSTGTVTSFTDADLGGGSFSNFVAYRANNADTDVSGSVGLDSFGYRGGTGDDTFTDSGADGGTIRGRGGDDVLIGGTGDNQIRGGSGNDTLIGGGGNDELNGGGGADTLIAGTSSGNLIGGGGADTIFVGENTSFVNAGNGNDSMVLPAGSTFSPFSPGSLDGSITLPSGAVITYLSVAEGNISIACFAQGTLIRTPSGPVAVEDLVVGQRVDTLDDGPQPIRWISAQSVPGEGRFAPVRFDTGAIGNDAPLYVSAQHRMLISGWRCELMIGEPEALCAATLMCNDRTIRRVPVERVTYYHIMFDRHQVVFANNAPAESYFVGDHQTSADTATYEELITLFPELADRDHPSRIPARLFLRGFEAKAMTT
ncbi:Hint domain-containing protein [Aliiroseovarius sp. 2305UL8-7]|uniref:Hint domain-containing protein n=1 Tax=Aliiroseovarius conchicola TaxID=3121637 RepID=UPI0035297981